jgi:hypothetical protein
MREQLGPGGRFSDLELPDHGGNPRRLSELAASDPPAAPLLPRDLAPKEQAFCGRLVQLQDEAEVA